MIKIIYDPQNLISVKESKVQEIGEYPQVVKTCLDSVRDGTSKTIVLVEPVLLQWFRNMSARYSQGLFVFETLDARAALAQRWNVLIPESVTNEDILTNELLSLDIHSQPGFNFDDTVLSYYYSEIFTSKSFPFPHISILLTTVSEEDWRRNRTNHLLSRSFNNRVEEWKKKANTFEQRQLIDLFSSDPVVLKHLLMEYRVLRSYPALGEALLGSSFSLFKTLKLSLDDLSIEESKIPDARLQVSYHLNNIQPQADKDIETLISDVSGLLTGEFDTLEKHLLTHPEWISTGLLDQLESKFASHSRRYGRRIKALRSQIRPVKPELPDMAWKAETMLEWATQQYLPYQAWCSAKEYFVPDLYSTGDRFSEWLISHWSDLHANSTRFVFNILANKAADLKQAGRVNLVLVIDNLGWSYSEIVRGLFEERGYFLTGAEPYLAMLPSETEISKKCLLSGAVGYNAIDDKTYKSIIEKGWVPYFNNSAFRYVSDIGSLGKIETIDAATYVVNYLAVDKALHKSADEIGMPHTEHVAHLLSHLVDNVIAFIDKHALQDKIRIHVVSDHGSTRIPATIQNDLDPNFFKASGFEARSHRFVEVSDDKFVSLADNLKLDCFFLPAHEFMNPKNVLCARRANRFLPTDQSNYVHGGLLPEEVIVPYMAFEPVTVPIQDVTVLFKKNLFRYRMETVELEVGNPNDSAVEQVQVILLNGNVESEPFTIPLLNSKSKVPVQIPARFKLTSLPEEQNTLRLRVRFRARGEIHTTDAQANIVMRKLVEEKSSGLFED